MNRIVPVSAALAACLLPTLASAQITSFLFKETVPGSSGQATINLMRPKSNTRSVNGVILEAFRQDNGGKLVFAVDVNEANSGSEYADAQGVAVAQAELSVVIGGQTRRFSTFMTPTQSLLAPAGTAQRSTMYTLIGNAGTNRVSPSSGSELTGSSMDETLHIPVDIDLSAATAASLTLRFADVNVGLGDPEAFYDYTGGYEELALLTAIDVAYLDSLAPGRSLAPLIISQQTVVSLNWQHFPSSSGYFFAAYEDLFPAKGDYDFNDLVVAYRVSIGTDISGSVRKISGSGYLVARGAEYDHDWHLRIGLPAAASGTSTLNLYAAGASAPMSGYPKSGSVQGDLVLNLAPNIAAIFSDGGSTYVNTFAEQRLVNGPRFEFEVVLDTPVSQGQMGVPPFDPFIYVHQTGYEVHIVDRSPVLPYSRNTRDGALNFRDSDGYPFALIVPENWQPPLAGVDMGLAYPNFVEHVQSLGSKQAGWYSSPAADKIKGVPASVWRW